MTIEVFDWIASAADVTPDKVALTDLHSKRSFTYKEFDKRVGQVAAWLRDDVGVTKGDRVAVLSFNNPEFLEVQFACMRLGSVFVPVNFRLAVPELEYIVKDCAPKVLISEAELAETGTKVAELCELSHHVITNSDGSDCSYEQAVRGRTPVTDIVDSTLEDLWCIMYTSGTTGRPKGCMITYMMGVFNAVNLAGAARLDTDCVHFCFMPLFHTGGLNVFTNPAFHMGGSVVLMRNFDPGQVMEVISDPKYGVTHFIGVPAMFQFMAQHPGFEKLDVSRMRGAFVGAAPMPVALLNVWLDKGLKLQQGFGMTETGPSCLGLPVEDAKRKVGSSGKPVLHVKVKVVDEDGNEVPRGGMGELWCKGPTITKGYWNRPDANEKDFTDGWLHTGDAVRVDEDGYYYIVDRTKDMYISGGENVYPAEVEDCLFRLEGVLEVAIIGVADDKWGEVGKAIITQKPGANVSEEAVISHCKENLAAYKVPKSVEFVQALPRNATGKVLKTTLREQFGSGAGAIPKN